MVSSTGAGASVGGDGPFVGVGRRRDPRVLEHARLARAAPQVDVDRVRRGLGDRDLDAALGGVVDLLVAGQAHPDAHRRDDLEPRIEGVGGDIEADLVVALAGAAVGDRVGALALGDLDEELRDERPGERGGQRIGALVQRVGLEVRPHEIGDEALARVDHVGARGAGGDRPGLDALAQRAAAEIDRQGHDLASNCSLSQATATEVSSPPEYARTTLFTGSFEPPERAWMVWKRSSQRSRRDIVGGTGRGAYCRPPASLPARAGWIRRWPGR